MGVDLVNDGYGGWTVIELNGTVEVTHEYQPDGDVFVDVAAELARHAVRASARPPRRSYQALDRYVTAAGRSRG